MGSAYKALGKLDEAESIVRKAISLAPDMELAWTNLGV
jgi:Flp pilus assembly protein TadD